MPIIRSADDWQPEHVVRFWDWHASRSAADSFYFGLQAGAAVTHLLKLKGLLHGRVLDFGCGPGYLLEHLARQGVDAYGVDSSPGSVEHATHRCQGLPGFRGVQTTSEECIIPFDGHFDLIVCCETIEHLRVEQALRLYANLASRIRAGGHLLVTAPFAEDLNQGMAYCPFCDCEFHRWQHFRSLTKEALLDELQRSGLEVVQVDAIDVARYDPKARLSQRPVWWRLIDPSRRLALFALEILFPTYQRAIEQRWRTSAGPNLYAIARKKP